MLAGQDRAGCTATGVRLPGACCAAGGNSTSGPQLSCKKEDGCLATGALAGPILQGSGNRQLNGVCTPWLQGYSCGSLEVDREEQCSITKAAAC